MSKQWICTNVYTVFFVKIFKNLTGYTSENNFVGCLSVNDNAAESFNILVIIYPM